MAPGIADFLLGRIAADEERARNARPQDGDPEDRDYDRTSWHEAGCGYRMGEFCDECSCPVPARVLAECDAKRRIVEEHGADADPCAHAYDTSLMGWMCVTLRLLALPYADHSDYDEAWRP